MLTLTRKIGESIRIGDDIVVVVKEIKGKQVRLGIEAPRDVYVCREELFQKIEQANRSAIFSPQGSPENNNSDPLAALGSLILSQRTSSARPSDPSVNPHDDEGGHNDH